MPPCQCQRYHAPSFGHALNERLESRLPHLCRIARAQRPRRISCNGKLFLSILFYAPCLISAWLYLQAHWHLSFTQGPCLIPKFAKQCPQTVTILISLTACPWLLLGARRVDLPRQRATIPRRALATARAVYRAFSSALDLTA